MWSVERGGGPSVKLGELGEVGGREGGGRGEGECEYEDGEEDHDSLREGLLLRVLLLVN